MKGILAKRRADCSNRLKELEQRLSKAKQIAKDTACVYVIGSFGRGEASPHSDLDLFIAGYPKTSRKSVRRLSELNAICLKAELIQIAKELKFREFSGDGEFLAHYAINDLVKTTGKPVDDANNTFTARLLLLLESKPLIGADVYSDAIEAVISKYWRDYAGHENTFVPAFLANDILRLWRTFCVNYEARTMDVPDEKKNKRRLKNYKLKHSRMLTCYSALIYLLAIYNDKGTVGLDEVKSMTVKTPTERLEWLLTVKKLNKAHSKVRTLLDKYEQFLENTNADEATLLGRIADERTRQMYFSQAGKFGDTVFDVIQIVGNKSPLHRLLVV